MSQSINRDSRELEYLKKDIVRIFNTRPTTPSDFNHLEKQIKEALKKYGRESDKVSASSLQRLWNYGQPKTDGEVVIGINTLNKLARCMQCRDWDDYLEKMKMSEEVLFDPMDIQVSLLKTDEIIVIGWYPDHYIKAKYIGNSTFDVLEASIHMKKQAGQQFKAKRFELSYPLGLNNTSIGYSLWPSILAMNEEELGM